MSSASGGRLSVLQHDSNPKGAPESAKTDLGSAKRKEHVLFIMSTKYFQMFCFDTRLTAGTLNYFHTFHSNEILRNPSLETLKTSAWEKACHTWRCSSGPGPADGSRYTQ